MADVSDVDSTAVTLNNGENEQHTAEATATVDQTSSEMETETKELTELEKYWKAVKDNPTDFTGWTYLLQFVEQENNVEAAREAFDAFLKRYPYCYGYWKKYADLLKRQELADDAEQVFESGLHAIPLSSDLWLHYIAFVKSKHESDVEKDQGTKAIRNLYERAISAAGTDFRSDKLWDSYIDWEKENENLVSVTNIYDKILAIPTQLYSHHFENFKLHVKANNPKDILKLDEFLKLRGTVMAKKAPGTLAPPEAEDDDARPPGEEVPPGEEGAPGDVPVNDKLEDEENEALREEIIETRKVVHQQNEEEVSRRWSYEEGIRRPYFHVKPLEKSQLKNWKEYLNFEIENGTHDRAVILFERCVIACALYEEFWLKYANYLESHDVNNGVEMARNVFQRACQIHLPTKPNIHLTWAGLEERSGKRDEAMQVLTDLNKNVPNLAMVQLRMIGLLRRQGDFPKVEETYEKLATESPDNETCSFYAIKYSRYLAKVVCNFKKAVQVLDTALEKDQTNPKLHLQLIDLEFQQKEIDEESLMKRFQSAIDSPLEIEHRLAFSQRRMAFLEDFSSTITPILSCYENHQKLLKEHSVRKRKASENADVAQQPEKKAKTENGTNGAGDTQSQQATQPYSQQQTTDPMAAYNYQWQNYNYNYQHPGWNYQHYYGTQ